METYGKNYETPEERDHRYGLFLKNLQLHDEEEKRHPGVVLGVTQFSDWTDSELRYLVPNQTIKFPETVSKASIDIDSRPENFDLRNLTEVTPIKYQGFCGSCWAFSTVAAIEILIGLRKQTQVNLSEQELIDCDRRSFGCRGGYHQFAMNFVKTVGLCAESEYPYKEVRAKNCSLNCKSPRAFIDEYAKLDKEENSIAYWVYKNGPVAFSMNMTKSLFSYRSGIFHPAAKDCQENSFGYHGMTIVGYGVSPESQPYWVVRNSWGVKWGENGYMRLARGVNACGMAEAVYAPIVK